MTLVAIGPLTNIALLFKVFPETKPFVREIVLMGGAVEGGNATPVAEFNIYADPHAAKVVFESGLPVVMCGLDATRKTSVDRKSTRLNSSHVSISYAVFRLKKKHGAD